MYRNVEYKVSICTVNLFMTCIAVLVHCSNMFNLYLFRCSDADSDEDGDFVTPKAPVRGRKRVAPQNVEDLLSLTPAQHIAAMSVNYDNNAVCR